MTDKHGIGVLDVFGLKPLPLRAREAWLAVRGDGTVPPTRFGLSSLGILHPTLSIRTWLGSRRPDRLIPISNLFNHTPTPLMDGWSVRKTQVRDFRGGRLTYDSHNGTDFAVPIGTTVTAAAGGTVLRVSSELHRGGLKVFIDHGRGLFTSSNHLARSLVRVGDVVRRGQPIALSGYSGVDALVAFPWSVPHVHFNVWLNGEYTDPFAAHDGTSLWTTGNEPSPATSTDDRDDAIEPSDWDEEAVSATIHACKDDALRATLLAEADPPPRAMNVFFAQSYFPTRFTTRPPLLRRSVARERRLSLPFAEADFDGVTFADV